MRILVTGGAGFIGSFVVDRLLAAGHTVRVLDNLDPQVHPEGAPAYLAADAELVHGRNGKVGARSAAEIGMHAVRGGDAAGDHTVYLFGTGERLEITHRASTRDIFAQGALRAARWIVGRKPGRYRFREVLLPSRTQT